MAYRIIPQSFVYACDCCGITHTQQSGNAYPDHMPPKWLALDMRGELVSYPHEQKRKLLCDKCGEKTLKAIENVEP